jgi:hypothetical protein
MSPKSRDERPDGILIADDHIVEYVTRGLVSEQIRVPRDVKVVAHCNWPLMPAAMTPVDFLGFDARELIRRCIARIDAERSSADAGKRLPALTHIQPVMQHELTVPGPISPAARALTYAETADRNEAAVGR